MFDTLELHGANLTIVLALARITDGVFKVEQG